jgi:hypothetical protein
MSGANMTEQAEERGAAALAAPSTAIRGEAL